MQKTIVTSFGGMDYKIDRHYAIMAWGLMASIEKHDGAMVKKVIGAPSGSALKMAKSIAKDFSNCTAVEAPASPDKFCSKIHAMKKAYKMSSQGDIICYLDADVMNWGPCAEFFDKFKKTGKMISTQLRLRQRQDAKKFRSWVIMLNVDNNTELFLDKWMGYATSTTHKFSDQEALYKAWKDLRSSEEDAWDAVPNGMPSTHFGGWKLGSKFQSKARGAFAKGHSGAMKSIQKEIGKQPLI
jgi:hypothetical protein